MGEVKQKAKTITLHHEGLNQDKVVPNNGPMLRVLARSGWKPKGDAGKPVAKPAGSDKT